MIEVYNLLGAIYYFTGGVYPVPVCDRDGVPQQDEGEAQGEAIHK